ncbi:MAG TPA: 2-amino-4-hydroxy-6-hydroxymethyldihydropteridine diphosphokinase [Sulfurovum sp.]|jgi:2-amino-4-hydroxy-6-hydroxymethyldihydropteridine diphosphokinase|nr:MAG: 2-amino-4-hydroxy-6-hydroxymethyldihydropteridine diphosphokinase [Sulfurovum sp. 35-42-20]OYY57471.1 MAG: 2-amino-4-hydroxy-6-hydroxymethyldihydropteridine diphosphokinase [Sulfurovum sp. 28-43-6]OYZ26643.1 MAG: 2-amino-4-hydroxy-6-hydroxymethyldihydropteridine diphosphokinase [Sulfurovum sp. 16-42-52]OYZ48322.1 MAG: 2-amino-4-hydroxy-6-hydroxymethyldihydropteridine diphosphokinase [Sulfurovum sp. 24-42-9]OZA47073.1 MAG: 2-amino-4-hydroxy-6-hydroxymethyldihydropteridine diphosphokinase
MIQKKIDAKHTIIKTPCYPYRVSQRSKSRQGSKKVLLGIGGNVGDVVRRFEHLFWYLNRSRFVQISKSAPIVKNPPFGYLEQADFYNSLLLVETRLSPRALLRYVLHVEKIFGRKRLFKDAPRTLDIDIIFYENIDMKTKELTLPHPHWQERASVVIPLGYLK